MKRLFLFITGLLFLGSPTLTRAEDEWVERLHDFLTVSTFNGAFRVRLSGTVDIEDYQMQQPPPGLLYTARNNLVNPRLTIFLDAQMGSHVYAFVQSRVDRGFDPADRGAQIRLDEYAVRYTPWDDGRLNLQVGKFATVAGNWVKRHLSWDNPFVTAPLPYENLTGIWDSSAPEDAEVLQSWAYVPYAGSGPVGNSYLDKRLRVPIVWGPSYATGLSLAGQIGKFEYAAEIKNASLSSRPESWDLTAQNFSHPTFTGRVGFSPNLAWNFGLSASTGAYLTEEAASTVPKGRGIGDYQQQLLAQDISFEWHHWQVWAECYETRFQVPAVGNADTIAYYIETKYKFTPQLFGALRWNQQLFGKVPYEKTEEVPWGNDLWRIDVAGGYRFTPYSQLKLQYSVQHEENARDRLTSLFAAQFTLKF